MNVKSIFDPIGIDTFLSEYYEQKHLLIKRNERNFYSSLISFNDIDEVLFAQKLNAPSFRLVNSKMDTFPDAATFCYKGTNVINPKKFVQGYTEGHTLAMAGFQQLHQGLRNFCQQFEDLLGHPFQTNLYLTPADSKGFSPHWDAHDVFVLQISGSKHWKIYENGMPLADAQLKFEKDGFDAGKVVEEFTLEEGDFLYIPRGLTHDAYTDTSNSLHITTGLLGYTWSQYLIESIVHLAKSDVAFRKFIPLGIVHADKQSYDNQVLELLSSLKKELDKKEGLSRFNRELKDKQYDCSSKLLLEVLKLDELNLESSVIRRYKRPFRLVTKEDKVFARYKDISLEFPLFCEPILRFINDQSTAFCVNQLPNDLDEPGKLVLVKRLIKEGLVLTAEG